MKTNRLVPTLAIAISISGCGGSTSNSLINQYAGTYSGNLTLDNSKNGALALTVTSTGTATGTLTVTGPPTAPSRGANNFTFSLGTTNITGTVGSDGSINISGTDAGSGLFTVGGSIGANGGNITIDAGGQNYTGTISTNLNGGGGGAITLTNGNGTNAILSNFPENPFILMSTVGGSSSIVASPQGGGNARTLLISLGTDAVPGSTVTYTSSNFASNTFSYGEGGSKSWRATAGTATIVSRTTNTFQISFNNVTMTAESDTSATGSFTLNGTLKK